MALRHDAQYEVACNLLDPQMTPPSAVQACLEQLLLQAANATAAAADSGISVVASSAAACVAVGTATEGLGGISGHSNVVNGRAVRALPAGGVKLMPGYCTGKTPEQLRQLAAAHFLSKP